MIGKKLYKNNADDMAQYTATAQWCNANNAHIEDKGSYYEVCENVTPEPTPEEKIAKLDAEYEQSKQNIALSYVDAVMTDDTELQEGLKEDLIALNESYDEQRKELEGAE